MLWQVDAATREPLVDQVSSSVRCSLCTGELVPGERLPPARELAELLGINVNTVLAAYRVLREEGTVEFRRGRGVRVAPAVNPAAVARTALSCFARSYLDQGRRHGWTVDDLTGLLEELA